jgi:hypothetical protein|tara:strand:- start:1 stop:156 length:156 start_codon:yes stop_codon:yes gene_type:complete
MAELITSPTLLAHKVKELEEKMEYVLIMIDEIEKNLHTPKAKNGKKTKKND